MPSVARSWPAAGKSVQVLIIDNEPAMRRPLRAALEAEGYGVHEAASARDGETLAGNRRIDLFLIELDLPDRDGVELVRRLRSWTQRPVIVLCTRVPEHRKVTALDAGADDVVVKPFGTAELLARLRAALRRSVRGPLSGRSSLQCGALRIDLSAKAVWRDGALVPLTATQWRLLEVLARHAGHVVPATTLLHEVWGPRHADHGHYLRIYMRQLRQRLEADPARPVLLLTETGVGYRLVADPD